MDTMTSTEAAEYIKVSPSHLRKTMRKFKVEPTDRDQNKILWSVDDVKAVKRKRNKRYGALDAVMQRRPKPTVLERHRAILNKMAKTSESYTFVTKTGEKVNRRRGCENCTLCPDCGLVLVFCRCEGVG